MCLHNNYLIFPKCSCRTSRVFVAVARSAAFPAAGKLHRTQPAVSQAIRRLEDELGDRLFDRSSKDGALTDAGVLLLDYAAGCSRLADEARARPSASCATSGAARVLIGPMRRPCTRAAAHRRGSRHRIQAWWSKCGGSIAPDCRGARCSRAGLRRADVSTGRRGLQSMLLGGDDSFCWCIQGIRSPGANGRHRGSRPPGRHRAQRSVADARARAAALRAQHAPINIQISSAEPGRHQARGGDGCRGCAVAAPLCAHRNRAGHLVAVKIPELSARRTVRFVHRKAPTSRTPPPPSSTLVRGGQTPIA